MDRRLGPSAFLRNREPRSALRSRGRHPSDQLVNSARHAHAAERFLSSASTGGSRASSSSSVRSVAPSWERMKVCARSPTRWPRLARRVRGGRMIRARVDCGRLRLRRRRGARLRSRKFQVFGPKETAAPYAAGSIMFWPPRLPKLPPTKAMVAVPHQAPSSPTVSTSRMGRGCVASRLLCKLNL